ncbi:MAG: ABC transporter ATP-binding protein [Proteobacteria bacterium]|nr:ABC transporter ATP-binding protein [Pseudomonadota bacterium]
MTTQIIIEGFNISKNYDSFKALDNINFFVKEGEIVGFLGPNGAGKTTLIKLITCTSFKTSGKLKVFGLDTEKDQKKIKALIGLVPQDNNFDPDFTVYENLLVFSRYFGIKRDEAEKRIQNLLNFVGLQNKRDEKVTDLSGGMKRKLIIARSLINDPELIILDEPTTGLDPQARRKIWEMIEDLKKNGKTIILTTHYMEEAEKLCDRIYIMDAGKIITWGNPKELIIKHIGTETIEIYNCEDVKLNEIKGKKIFFKDRIYIHTDNKKEALEMLTDICENIKFTVRPTNLEDLFIYLTGKELKE